jgi:sensor histidine kinase YesM
MKRNFLNSIRTQMLINILGVLLILVGSAAYILFSTIRMQAVIEKSFEKQRSMKEIQSDLEEFQQPLLEYLSSRSSNALAELLIRSQKIHGTIPRYDSIPADQIGLQEKEAYALVSSYLDLADKAIEEKRGMDVARYTSLYGEMQDLLLCINTAIDTISNERLVAQLSEYGRFIDASRDIQLWNLLFIIFISIFSLFLIINAVDRINGPMVKLSSMASEISGGNFDVADIGTTSLFEVDQAVVAFNLMKKDIRTYIDELRWQRNVEKEYLNERVRNMRMEEMIRRMELYTLQAQMNPHFLFNTLNTGIQLAIVEGAERTGEYMENLTKLFRHNLHEKNVIVPLRHEIEGLESYFYILGVRFPKNLDLVLDCPQDILDLYRVPASILQPLVENCIVHAFKGGDGRNSIVVRVYVESGRLCLSVADNGCGMDADTVVTLLHRASGNEPREKVMGLENVIQRLYFFFPEDPEVITINSRVGEGTEILVRIDTGKDLCIPY